MNDNKKQAEKIKEISGANPLKCMKCGKCSASCPAFDEMDIILDYIRYGIDAYKRKYEEDRESVPENQ